MANAMSLITTGFNLLNSNLNRMAGLNPTNSRVDQIAEHHEYIKFIQHYIRGSYV